jgi:hypothetical protein
MTRKLVVVFLLIVLVVPSAQAAIIGFDLGTGAPPATLGGFQMTPFPLDPRPIGSIVMGMPSPLGDDLGFIPSLSHSRIGMGWGTWSHGYTGDVYSTEGTSVTLVLPPRTDAFYFYAEPAVLGTFTFTVIALGGPTFIVPIDSVANARGFGFFGTEGSSLNRITVSTVPGAEGFAIGEFGISAIPEPTTLLLVGTGMIGVARFRRFRRVRK